MRLCPRNHGDHERRAGETLSFGRDPGLVRVRLIGFERRRDRLADAALRLAFDNDETPGHETAVIRDACSDGQQRVQFVRAGAGPR
jgi:hypothetical protein